MTTKPIDSLLEEAVQTGDIPGVVAVAATADGVLYQGAFGRRAVDSPVAMTTDSVFWLASMTKAITSTAAMQLVERGRLHLDEPIDRILPELAALEVLEGFSPSGEPKLRPAKRPVTLRHLMTHTAGFTYDMWNADMVRYMEQAQIPNIIACQNLTLRTPLVFDPGDRWEYGINLDWVGKAVEAASGQSLQDYLQENVFDPLGMEDTGFQILGRIRSRLAAMHQRAANGTLTRIDFEVPQDPEFFMGGGGLYSTAHDYLKFTQMLMREGQAPGSRILSADTVHMMGQNHIGDLNVRPLKSAMPDITNDAEFFPGMVKKWGLGFMINTEMAPTGRRAGSMAWAGLANTYFWIDPEEHITGILLTQILPFADAKVLDLFARFEEQIYQLRA